MAQPPRKKSLKQASGKPGKKPARRAAGKVTDKADLPKTKPRQSDHDIASTALGAVPDKRTMPRSLKADAEQLAKRNLAERVRTAKGRKISSTLWLQRQLNDPFVTRARAEGFRSRAAYKIQEIDDKYHLFKRGGRIVDLGAAPGGWCQIAAKKVGVKGKVVGIDYLNIPAIDNVELLQMDFTDDAAPDALKQMLDGPADVVLSDMAAPTTGHKSTDHLSIIALCEMALDFAEEVLVPGGHFVAKTFQGGAEGELLTRLKKNFEKVVHVKPKASRADSAEMYVVAISYRGKNQ